MTVTYMIAVLVIIMVAIIAMDAIEFLKSQEQLRPDAFTDLSKLWNLMRAHDANSVILSQLTVSSEGQITTCRVIFEHKTEGKVRRVAADYRKSGDHLGYEPIARAIERLELDASPAVSWNILIRIQA